MELEIIYNVRDDEGRLWVYHERAMHSLNMPFEHICCASFEDGIEKLKELGYIKPDPLQKALDAVDNRVALLPVGYIDDDGKVVNNKDTVKKIMRTLYEELTE